MTDSQPARIGMWSARIVFVLVAAFGLSLAAGLVTPTLTVSFALAMILAPAFVVMIAAIAAGAPHARRIWGQLGIAFAVVYCVLVTTTYYLQLAVVQPGRFAPDVLSLLQFTPGSALFALDMLGYGFMAMATLVISPVFVGPGLNRWLRWWFVGHGLLVVPSILAPLLLGAGPAGSSDLLGSLANIGWSVFFLPLAAMVHVYFARARALAG